MVYVISFGDGIMLSASKTAFTMTDCDNFIPPVGKHKEIKETPIHHVSMRSTNRSTQTRRDAAKVPRFPRDNENIFLEADSLKDAIRLCPQPE